VKYLLDTNVYLGAFRSEQKKAQFRQTFFPLLPATHLSSVVAYELYVNAQDSRTRSLTQEFIRFQLIHRHKDFSLRVLVG